VPDVSWVTLLEVVGLGGGPKQDASGGQSLFCVDGKLLWHCLQTALASLVNCFVVGELFKHRLQTALISVIGELLWCRAFSMCCHVLQIFCCYTCAKYYFARGYPLIGHSFSATHINPIFQLNSLLQLFELVG